MCWANKLKISLKNILSNYDQPKFDERPDPKKTKNLKPKKNPKTKKTLIFKIKQSKNQITQKS